MVVGSHHPEILVISIQAIRERDLIAVLSMHYCEPRQFTRTGCEDSEYSTRAFESG
jgi:hypothetical protein